MFKNDQKETLNNVLFVFFCFLFFAFGLPIRQYVELSTLQMLGPIFLLLLLFSGMIYGCISKNPPKSFLLGFLFFPIASLFDILNQLFTTFILLQVNDFIILFIVSILWGLPGYFVAKTLTTEGKKRWVYLMLVPVSFLMMLAAFALMIN